MNQIQNYTNKIFEDIKHIDENGCEYWYARELQRILEYKKWQKFLNVIDSAIISCKSSGFNNYDHFTQTGKMVNIGSKTSREILDYKLSRYACYLIVQNADPSKETVALGQTYFAVQTRRQELNDSGYELLSEDQKRLYQRDQTKKANYLLNRVAIKSGVKNLDKFHNEGYKGLYNGETAGDIFKRKKLRYREDILDNMGSNELSYNLFRISLTEQKLKKDNVKSGKIANITHFEIGKRVRKTIEDVGGTMPEDLSTPKKSIKEIEKNNKKGKLIKGGKNESNKKVHK